jgi:hypothetical protein
MAKFLECFTGPDFESPTQQKTCLGFSEEQSLSFLET